MLCHSIGHGILLGGQVKKFGHGGNINMGGTGLAVVAVHTAAGHVDGVSGAENMSIALVRCGRFIVFIRCQHLLQRVAAHYDNIDAVAVQAVLDTLGDCQGHAEGGAFRL